MGAPARLRNQVRGVDTPPPPTGQRAQILVLEPPLERTREDLGRCVDIPLPPSQVDGHGLGGAPVPLPLCQAAWELGAPGVPREEAG